MSHSYKEQAGEEKACECEKEGESEGGRETEVRDRRRKRSPENLQQFPRDAVDAFAALDVACY